MAVQQISLSGATAPFVPAPAAVAPQNTTSTPVIPQQAPTSGANAMYSLSAPQDINSLRTYDPFNIYTEGLPGDTYDVKNSPGYNAYGDNWASLLNTMQSMPMDWSDTQRFLKGSDLNAPGGRTISAPNLSPDQQVQLNSLKMQLDKAGGSNRVIQQQIQDLINPLSQEGSLRNSILASVNRGEGADPVETALPKVAATFGLDPSSEQAKTMAQAYVSHALQSNAQGQFKTDLQASKRHALVDGPLGTILSIALALTGNPILMAAGAFGGAVQGFRHDDPLAVLASAAGGLSAGSSAVQNSMVGPFQTANGLAPVLSETANVANTLGLGTKIASLGKSIAAGDPFGIVANTLGTATSGAKLYDSSSAGTTGTNASSGGSTLSSASSALGLDPNDLQNGLKYLDLGGTAVKTALPFFDSPTQTSSNSAASPSADTPAEMSPGTPRPSGEALPSAAGAPNPAQAGYHAPTAGSTNLGGGYSQGRTKSMLRAIGA